MVLKEQDIKKIVSFVKAEPKTIQEVSKLIKKSWLTADSYVKQIKEQTGQIDIKVFRKGTQGALKIVFYNHAGSMHTDDLKENFFNQIKVGRWKDDFDFMEIYQYILEDKKKVFSEEFNESLLPENQNLISSMRKAKNHIYFFSGNLSFTNIEENGEKVLSVMEELLKRKVQFKILTRITVTSIKNINQLLLLIKKYPNLIEIRHCYQPLRGLIIDDDFAQFKVEEYLHKYKLNEIEKNKRIFYEIHDKEWIAWLQKVFWNLFRFSIEYDTRIKELKKIF
ncbi:MAG: hypothetical protein KKA65_05060 [Nanoarchaeota archaeon]|nr:hypothetical protein [Nanoarchaeota archaeon]MBU4241852.1 hypothetical protein [Nanoarchaeota archaeon]MBU4351763.1 hypothetical protein [Nanoarchaeota archaeon]MBU4456844.1 hypothetical protein [Nanoarchaeota archaeon]MCG2719465.1 hypothetical protein [Nanoarchaeota archaeon]